MDSPSAKELLKNVTATKRISFTKTFAVASKECHDLLRKLLKFNPNERIDVDGALSHPYLAEFHDPQEEDICKSAVRIPISDNVKLSQNDYRKAL